MSLQVSVLPAQHIGAVPAGSRAAVPIAGGHFEVDPASYYFRTTEHRRRRFQTAAPRYAFLNRLLAVGVGEIRPDGPIHLIDEIL
jgi:hypothetical protein